MPNIRTYESQVRPPGASSARSSASAASGAALGQGFESLGQSLRGIGELLDKRQGAQETSSLTKDYATGFAAMTQSWNNTAANADPNDPAVAEQWRQEVLDPFLEKFGADVGSTAGTALRQDLQQRLRMHFFDKTVGDQAILAGAAVKTNLDQSVNALSQAAYADPSSAEFSIQTLDQLIDVQVKSHNLTPAQAATIREDITKSASASIAKSALRGMAERNPEAAQKAIAEGRFTKYLSGEESSVANNYAKAQQEAKANDAARAKDDAIREAGRASDARRSEIMQSFSVNGQVRIPKDAISKILADPIMQGPDKDALIGIVKRLEIDPTGGEENKGPAFWDTYQRVMAPANSPNRITDPLQIYNMAGPNGALTLSGAEALVRLMKGREVGNSQGNFDTERQHAFFSEMHRQIAQTPFGSPRVGGESDYYKFQMDKMRQIDAGLAAGKTLESLLSPDSADYVGKDWKSYVPPPPVDTYVPPAEEKPRSWFEFFGQMMSGGPAFNAQELDTKLEDGDAGRAQGLVALKAAIAAGQISREDAGKYAIKRGWARASEPTKQGPQVQPVMK